MRQLVIVVSDLYLAAGAALPGDRERSARSTRASLPGFGCLTRFGMLEELPRGWRSWLAAWLGREDLSPSSPASIAACTPPVARQLSAGAASTTGGETQTAGWVWLADPVHLVASLTSVHLSPAGLLRLDEREQAALCGAFDTAFATTGYALVPSRCGRFLALGPAPPGAIQTTDPARCLGSTIADALPQGRAAGALRRLGGEIEMWLHEHPINAARARLGQPPVSTLWLWGGGAPLSAEDRAGGARNRSPAATLFGDDPYVEGLSSLVGATYHPAARSLASAATVTERTVAQIELFSSPATPLRAVEALDRDWIEPALELLARREVERLVVVANDRKVSMTRRDRLKRWRRPRSALAALADRHRVAERPSGRARP